MCVCVTPLALSPPDCMFEICPSTLLSNHIPYCDIMSYFKHLHPCISLYPDIDALHYGINKSRVANYERFLFKRLSGSSEQLFNCSTQPYQCKSRRPCKKKKKTRFCWQQGTRGEFYIVKVKFPAQSLSAQMLTWIICVQRKRLYH